MQLPIPRLRPLLDLILGGRSAAPLAPMDPTIVRPYTSPRPPGWPMQPLRVLGLGLPKTGTTTLALMMQRLHYNRLEYDGAALLEVAEGRVADALARTGRYEFVRDMPWCLLWEAYLARYPDARFVQTLRSNERDWLNSLRRHYASPLNYGYESPTKENVARWLGGDLVRLLGATDRIDAYRKHRRLVEDFFRDKPGRLLTVCWEEGDGWRELCGFLGFRTVRNPVPHENTARIPPRQRPKVFCIGLTGSGVNTVSRCLAVLGYSQLRFDVEYLVDMAVGRVAETLAELAPYEALVGLPWALVYRDLATHFPDARFILTRAATPELWDERNAADSALWSTYPETPGVGAGIDTLAERARLRTASTLGLYREHQEAVQRFFADQPGKLLTLCWDEGDGWEKLCGFLGEPVPDQPLPHDLDYPW